MTAYTFPREVLEDEERTMHLYEEDEAQMHRYLTLHGLRLPDSIAVQPVYLLCRHLYLRFGSAIRLASTGRECELQELATALTVAEHRYCVAVGKQNIPLAQRLARTVLKDYALFLV